ncbi:AGAP002650-PA-like protein [Anopheles sinensis]|uniref:AGAP002650-PA-like protein n=1 Tax=Anopheles sinensis TaxID=74873 RepID=A0A084W727_ANOSI|nr:AGAP002650-PA-like protein [Anopheles sinensis]
MHLLLVKVDLAVSGFTVAEVITPEVILEIQFGTIGEGVVSHRDGNTNIHSHAVPPVPEISETYARQQDSNNTPEPFPEPVCGQIAQLLDRCFHNYTPSVAVELLHSVQIPETVEQIDSRCVLFDRGMQCVERYLEACVDGKERLIIDNEVYGAKRLYAFLCRDRGFQQEFLRHKGCFQYVHHDLDECSKEFVDILKVEIARTSQQSFNLQYMHFCCARYAYESCVYQSARHKCRPDSAVFLRHVAKLLSTDRHFANCDKIENEICSADRPTWGTLWALVVSVGLLLPSLVRNVFSS